mmetsp:Transcript_10418/g.21059  ORF Transcript_10418/g.21059 Transcript_10418/m.21059 type:complete len:199 (-) Transcript_10418:77-673(-)
MQVFEQTDPNHGDMDKYAAEKAALEAAGSTATPEYALVLTNMAACLGCQGREEEALRLYREAKAACEQVGATDTPAYADALLNIGDSLNERGDYEEAMGNFGAAREIYERLGWEKTMNFAVVLHNMGECSFKRGQKDAAAKHYTAARDAYQGVLLGTESPQYAALLEDMSQLGLAVPDPPACPRLDGVDLSGILAGMD